MKQEKYPKVERCGKCAHWGYSNGKPWCSKYFIRCGHDDTACPEYKERR